MSPEQAQQIEERGYAITLSNMSHASIVERNLWAEYEARQKMSSFERGFQIACGVLLALILGFDAWLVWLIFF